MRILLIGGGGYLGIPLFRQLKSQGHFVIVYDSFKYDTQEQFHSSCCYFKGNVSDIRLRPEFDVDSFDLIIYLSQPRLGELNQIIQVKESINDFKHFINVLNGPKLIFISSCSVYGKTNEIVNENSPVIVTSLYSQMKIFCENILLETQNPNYKILRLSTLYGHSDYIRKDVFINNILEDIIQGKEIEIFDPFAKRPHLHVLDCARIIGELINCDVKEKILNIGFNELNINKIDLVSIIKNYENFEIVEIKTEDSRDYSVDFTNLKKYVQNVYILYKDGIVNYLNNHKISIN